jgi:hypothetical protein
MASAIIEPEFVINATKYLAKEIDKFALNAKRILFIELE